MKIEKNNIYNMNCLDGMDLMIQQSVKVDSIITDIPYGITACSYDEVIPFDKMWDRLKKLSKKHTPIVLFGKEPFTSKLICSNIENFKERVDWLKNKSGNGFLANQKHINVLEDIIVFSYSTKYTFNRQKWLVEDKEFLTQRKTFNKAEVGNNVYSKIIRTKKPDDGTRNPINIVSCRVPFTPSKSKTYSKDIDIRYHPHQKPLKLMKYLVETYSNEEDLVLDFTAGSGTTCVASKKLNRNYIGFEINPDYIEIANKRIQEI